MLGDEPLELADELRMPSEREVGVDPVLECGQPDLLESEGFDLGYVDRRPMPELECAAQRLRRAGRIADRERGAAGLREALELEDVDSARVDGEPIAAGGCLEEAVREQLSELGDVDLERVPGGVGRLLAPERVDQLVAGDDLARAEEEGREQGAALLAADLDRRTLDRGRQRPQQPEMRLHCGVLPRFQAGFSVPSARSFSLLVVDASRGMGAPGGLGSGRVTPNAGTTAAVRVVHASFEGRSHEEG